MNVICILKYNRVQLALAKLTEVFQYLKLKQICKIINIWFTISCDLIIMTIMRTSNKHL